MNARPPAPPAASQGHQALSRRAALLGGGGGLLAAALSASPPPARAAARPPPATSFARTPATDAKAAPAGSLTPDGRIRACPGSIPNCVSTSSTTSDLYRPALSSVDDPETAAALLDAAVERVCPGTTIVATADPAAPAGAVFRAYRVPRPPGPKESLSGGGAAADSLEVLLKPAPGAGSTVLFRSLAGGATYVFPFQTPLLDGVQGDRVRRLFRDALGWRPIGCDLLECFQ